MFEIIKSEFSFLDGLYDFQRIKEEMKGKFYVVHYKNDYVWMEIGAITENAPAIEIRRFKSGVLAEYYDRMGCVNLEDLKTLLTDWNYDQKKWGAFTISSLAKAIKQHLTHYISESWYDENDLMKTRNKILEEVLSSSQNYIASKGFYFSKSNTSGSSFLPVPCDGPFLEYTNGKDFLLIEYIIDLHDQYFCYHITLNGEGHEGVFPYTDPVNKIIAIIRKKLGD